MRPHEIESWLAEACAPLEMTRQPGEPASWSLRWEPGGRLHVGLRFDDTWATLGVQAPRGNAHAALDVLSRQHAWPGAVKQVAVRPRPMLRADIPLLAHTASGRAWSARQLRASCDAMLAAARREAMTLRIAASDAPIEDPELLAFTCASAGWSAVAKPDGTVYIDLQVRGAHRAIALQPGRAAVRAVVSFAPGALARASEPCRTASGELLMRASAALRWTRAFATHDSDRFDSAGFECSIASPCDEQALVVAVDSLIAACELFGREADILLEDPEAAARYLECVPGAHRVAEVDTRSADAAALPEPSAFPAARAALA